MLQCQGLARVTEQRLVAGALLGQVALQAAQAQVQGLGDAFGRRLAIWQLRLQEVAYPLAATGRLQLFQAAPEHGFVVLGQLRVAIVEALLEGVPRKAQQAFLGLELHGSAKHRLPRLGVERTRALQLHQQRGEVAAQAIATTAHVDRGEGVQRLRCRRRAARRDTETKLVGIVHLAQLQLQGIADHPVIAHDALEHLAQAAAGDQRITQGMEGGRADELRGLQAQRRITAGRHRQLPQTGGHRQRATRVGIVQQCRVEPGLAAQRAAVQAKGIELLAQGAGPAGQGGGFGGHADWRIR